MKRVAAVVVTYNRKQLLRENIECLLAQSSKDCLDVLIIDNASTDNTREYISEFIDEGKVKYYNTGANLGGAGGFHYGIKLAAENEYDYVWIMDDDCMPTETALSELLRADEKLGGNYGFLSSKTLWCDNDICKMNIQRRTLTKKVNDFSSESVPIVMASFVSLFIPVGVIKEVGLPIKEFFIWSDDLEYTRRISYKYKCYLCNLSVVIHKSDANNGSNIAVDSIERLERYKLSYRNEVYIFRREGIVGFFYQTLRLFLHIFRILFKSKDNKSKRIKCVLEGTKNGFSFKPEIEYVG